MMTSTALKRKHNQLAVEITLATVGCAIGTFITGEFDVSPAARLIGAILGAAVSASVTALAQRHRPRLAALVAVGITAAAVALNYVSFTVADYAIEQPATFPLPQVLPKPIDDGEGKPGWSGIKVDPTVVKCTVNSCQNPVTITSTGTKPLQLGKIRFDGPAAANFRYDGKCDHKKLPPGEKCRLNVRFMPFGAHGTLQARLVIDHNVPQGPTFVHLRGNAVPPTPPLTIDSITATQGIGRCLVYVVAKVSSPAGHNVIITGNARYSIGNQTIDSPLTLSPYPAGGPTTYRSNGQITLSGSPDGLRVGLTATNGAGQNATWTSTIQLDNSC